MKKIVSEPKLKKILPDPPRLLFFGRLVGTVLCRSLSCVCACVFSNNRFVQGWHSGVVFGSVPFCVINYEVKAILRFYPPV